LYTTFVLATQKKKELGVYSFTPLQLGEGWGRALGQTGTTTLLRWVSALNRSKSVAAMQIHADEYLWLVDSGLKPNE
jgi:hypothetical protein